MRYPEYQRINTTNLSRSCHSSSADEPYEASQCVAFEALAYLSRRAAGESIPAARKINDQKWPSGISQETAAGRVLGPPFVPPTGYVIPPWRAETRQSL